MVSCELASLEFAAFGLELLQEEGVLSDSVYHHATSLLNGRGDSTTVFGLAQQWLAWHQKKGVKASNTALAEAGMTLAEALTSGKSSPPATYYGQIALCSDWAGLADLIDILNKHGARQPNTTQQARLLLSMVRALSHDSTAMLPVTSRLLAELERESTLETLLNARTQGAQLALDGQMQERLFGQRPPQEMADAMKVFGATAGLLQAPRRPLQHVAQDIVKPCALLIEMLGGTPSDADKAVLKERVERLDQLLVFLAPRRDVATPGANALEPVLALLRTSRTASATTTRRIIDELLALKPGPQPELGVEALSAIASAPWMPKQMKYCLKFTRSLLHEDGDHDVNRMVICAIAAASGSDEEWNKQLGTLATRVEALLQVVQQSPSPSDRLASYIQHKLPGIVMRNFYKRCKAQPKDAVQRLVLVRSLVSLVFEGASMTATTLRASQPLWHAAMIYTSPKMDEYGKDGGAFLAVTALLSLHELGVLVPVRVTQKPGPQPLAQAASPRASTPRGTPWSRLASVAGDDGVRRDPPRCLTPPVPPGRSSSPILPKMAGQSECKTGELPPRRAGQGQQSGVGQPASGDASAPARSPRPQQVPTRPADSAATSSPSDAARASSSTAQQPMHDPNQLPPPGSRQQGAPLPPPPPTPGQQPSSGKSSNPSSGPASIGAGGDCQGSSGSSSPCDQGTPQSDGAGDPGGRGGGSSGADPTGKTPGASGSGKAGRTTSGPGGSSSAGEACVSTGAGADGCSGSGGSGRSTGTGAGTTSSRLGSGSGADGSSSGAGASGGQGVSSGSGDSTGSSGLGGDSPGGDLITDVPSTGVGITDISSSSNGTGSGYGASSYSPRGPSKDAARGSGTQASGSSAVGTPTAALEASGPSTDDGGPSNGLDSTGGGRTHHPGAAGRTRSSKTGGTSSGRASGPGGATRHTGEGDVEDVDTGNGGGGGGDPIFLSDQGGQSIDKDTSDLGSSQELLERSPSYTEPPDITRSPTYNTIRPATYYHEQYEADPERLSAVLNAVQGHVAGSVDPLVAVTAKVAEIDSELKAIEQLLAMEKVGAAESDISNDPVTADRLVRGVPALAATSDKWRLAFPLVCKLSQHDTAPEKEEEVDAQACMYIKQGVRLLCMMDMIHLRLKNVGRATATAVLREEYAEVNQLKSSVRLGGDDNSEISKLLRELKVSAALASKDEGDFEIPQEKLQASRPEVQEDADDRDDAFSHLRDAAFTVDEFSPPEVQTDAVSLDEDALRLMRPFASEEEKPRSAQAGEATSSSTDELQHITVTFKDLELGSKDKSKPGDGEGLPDDAADTEQAEPDAREPRKHRLVDKLIRETIASTTSAGGSARPRPKAAGKGSAGGATEVGTVDDATEMAEMERVMAAINMNPDADQIKRMMDKLKDDDVTAAYENNATGARYKNLPLMKLPKEFDTKLTEGRKHEKWTYQLLAESRAINEMVHTVTTACRAMLNAHLQEVAQPTRVQWCFVFDNSGSMVRMADGCAECLVILIETLRRLECQFAISVAGDANRARIVKNLKDDFNYSVGERCLANFTYNEATNMSSCTKSIAEEVFPLQTPRGPNERRILVLVTDGLCRELSDDKASEEFAALRSSHQLELAVLHTPMKAEVDYAQRAAQRLTNITDQLYFRASHDELSGTRGGSGSVLALQLVNLITKTLQRVLSKQAAEDQAKAGGGTKVRALGPQLFFDEKAMDEMVAHTRPLEARVGIDIALAARSGAATRPELMYDVSPPGGNGARTFELLEQMPPDKQASEERLAVLQIDLAQKRPLIESWTEGLMTRPDTAIRANEAEREWVAAAGKLKSSIADTVAVLEEHVFVNNKYTRRRPDFKGSQLHLQGLIKAVITDFAYKKFFSSKTAGGKRSYSCCIAVDVSPSMAEHLLDCAMETLVMLVEGLKEVGVDQFSVLLFGETVHVIKTEAMEWGPACVLSLLSSLQPEKHGCTRDADGIEVALQLLQESSVNSNQKLFVLTDGHTSCGMPLIRALKQAQDSQVEVIAFGVGMDKTNVSSIYPRWITAAIPRVVPEALRKLYEQDAQDAQPPAASAGAEKEKHFWDTLLVTQGAGAKSGGTKEILERARERFAGLQQMLTNEKEMKIQSGSGPNKMKIDLVFAVDTTGSMAPVITTVRAQTKGIVDSRLPTSIIGKVKEKFPEMEFELRCGLVGFRDYTDAPQFQTVPFTTDITGHFIPQAEQSLEARGGGDTAEDVIGGLEKAVDLDFQGQCRFVVLFTDAPCHGLPYSAGFADSRPHEGAATGSRIDTLMEKVVQRRLTIIHCKCDEAAVAHMEAELDDRLRAVVKRLDGEYRAACQAGTTNVPPVDPDPSRYYKSFAMLSGQQASATDRPGMHTVFVLDESGSMHGTRRGSKPGTPWDELKRAYHAFLQRRVSDQGTGDTVSVVLFDDSARTIHTNAPIASVVGQDLPYNGGNTNFAPALAEAERCISKASDRKTPQIIFMTDGGARDIGAACDTMRAIHHNLASRGLELFVVGFGSGADTSNLQALANAGNGKVVTASFGGLVSAFVKIAASSTPTDALFSEIGKRISEQVSEKLILDFL